MMVHITSMIRYFNKWGWIIDRERKELNKRLKDELVRLKQAHLMQCRNTEKHKASLMERHVDRGVMVPVGQQVIIYVGCGRVASCCYCFSDNSSQRISFSSRMSASVDHLFVLEGDGVIKDFPGNYTDYRKWKQETDEAEKAAAEQKKAAQTMKFARYSSSMPRVTMSRSLVGSSRIRKFGDFISTDARYRAKMTFKERKEFEELTAEIDSLTAERAALEAEFNSGATITGWIIDRERKELNKRLKDELVRLKQR